MKILYIYLIKQELKTLKFEKEVNFTKMFEERKKN